MKIHENTYIEPSVEALELSIDYCGHAKSGMEWAGESVNPPYTRVYFILGGDAWIYTDGKKRELKQGFCYIIPTGKTFSYGTESRMEQFFFHIVIKSESGVDIMSEVGEIIEFPADLHIKKVSELFFKEDVYSATRLRCVIKDTVIGAAERFLNTSAALKYSKGVENALKYIEENLSSSLSVVEIAREIFMSESTFSKAFKREVGTSVGRYIDNRIMAESEKLLTKTDMSVLQISEKFGFCDRFYFSRAFKRRYGEAPMGYRKKVRI